MKIFEMTTDDGSCSQFLEIQSYVQDNHKIQQKCLQLINQGKKKSFHRIWYFCGIILVHLRFLVVFVFLDCYLCFWPCVVCRAIYRF